MHVHSRKSLKFTFCVRRLSTIPLVVELEEVDASAVDGGARDYARQTIVGFESELEDGWEVALVRRLAHTN